MGSNNKKKPSFRTLHLVVLLIFLCLFVQGVYAPNSITVVAESNNNTLSDEDDFAGISVLIDQVKSENRSLHNLVDYLEAEGAIVEILEDKALNIRNIQEYDILILIEPFYDPSVEKVLEKYVKNGGSVLFAGDNRWSDYTNYVDFADISYQKNHPDDGYTQEIFGHPATQNVQKLYCAEPQSSLVVGNNASAIVMKDGFVEAAATWVGNGKFMVVADEHILLDDYYKSGDNHLFMHSILKWLRNVGFSINVISSIKKGEKITVQCEFINYRDNDLYINAVTESDKFEEINRQFALQPGKNNVEFQVSENIIEVFFIGEKDLTLKFEYNGRTIFSEDYVINVQASFVYIAVISAPGVILILLFVLTYVRKNRKK